MARELKGLVAGIIAGLFVVGASFGVSAIVTHGQPTEEQPTGHSPVKTPAGQTSASQLVATGQGLYLQACAGCHGKDAEGVRGPSLHNLGDPDAKIARNIKNGFPPMMPAYQSRFNDAQIGALVAYVQSLK